MREGVSALIVNAHSLELYSIMVMLSIGGLR